MWEKRRVRIKRVSRKISHEVYGRREKRKSGSF
jgi:hypothetical protein